MKFERIDIQDCSLLRLSELSIVNIEKKVLSANYGRVFVLNSKNIMIGTYSVDNFDRKRGVDNLENIPCVYEDNGFEKLDSQVLRIMETSIYYGILPVVDKNNVFKGGITLTDNTWDNDKISGLSYLHYLNEKNIDIGYYFREKNLTKIAFWGVDKLSLTFANLLRHSSGISVIGIYDNIKRKKYCKEDILNYEIPVNYINSFSELISLNIVDLVIITDWTVRHLNRIITTDNNIKAIYFNELLKSNDFDRAINTSIFVEWKNKLANKGIECISVRIPTETDLAVNKPKQNKISLEDRLQWFAKENNWELDSEELKIFNENRHKFSKNIKKSAGEIYFADFRSEYFNFINKCRVIYNTPKNYDNVIYLVGSCIVTSLFNQDKDTLGSFLQYYINENKISYKVIAIGIINDADRYYFFNILNSFNIKKGDKVFWFDQTFRGDKWDIDLINVYKKLYEDYGTDFYYDAPVHCGRKGMKEIAKSIYNYINLNKNENLQNYKSLPMNDLNEIKGNVNYFNGNPQLEKYKKFIISEALHKSQIIGSIVMNCNPFTFGHQYLIEYAADQVDYLYIFVVEENKSYFEFEDRFNLVKAGTSHLKNVKVLPSGEFIISSNTFSEYFDKANLKGTTIDTSLDVETFATQIAPVLDIQIRFVGEEPLDPITNQYNESMKEILPRYGIELREIPRKEFGENVISASRVRKCLEKKEWDEIKKLVPKTTYDFLYEKFN